MSSRMIKISGTGCALADFLYSKVDFNSPRFVKYLSKQLGDGGLSPGKLVFTEELEKFAGKGYSEILAEIIGDKSFDSVNIGGPSLVSLIHTAQLLGDSEFEVSYFGCAGFDSTANLIFEMIQKLPLNINNYKQVGNKKTAFTDVLSDPNFDQGNGERTFINNIGASWDYTPEMLPQAFFDSQIVCFGGTALVPHIHDNLHELLRKAKENNCITLVNTVFDFRNEKQNPRKCWPLGKSFESYKLIDILIMDCEEALKISGALMIEDAALFFKQQEISSFIITNGSKNLYAFSNGSIFQPLELKQFPISDCIKNELKDTDNQRGDTTGCGDNFAGGIIASIALQLSENQDRKFDMIDAIAWGVASGGFACFYLGGTYIEKSAGEKIAKIENYKNKYLKQLL